MTFVPGKKESLEGLRGVACVMVVFDHLQATFIPNWFQQIGTQAGHYLPAFIANKVPILFGLAMDGGLAVTIFWILSGYVLTYRFNQTGDLKKLPAAFAKRYFRLAIPTLCASLLAVGVINYINTPLHLYLQEPCPSRWVPTFIGNNGFLAAVSASLVSVFVNFDISGTSNPVLWTMGREFVGSLLCFALVGVFPKRETRLLIYLLTFVLYYLSGDPRLVGQPDGGNTWVCCFVVGMALTEISSNLPRIFVVGAGLPVAIAAGLLLHAKAGGWLTLPLGTLLVGAALFHSFARKILELPVLVFLGKISFSLYLIHIPVILTVGCLGWIWGRPYGEFGRLFLASSLTLLAVLPLSYLFEKGIDGFAVSFSNRIGSRVESLGKAPAGKS